MIVKRQKNIFSLVITHNSDVKAKVVVAGGVSQIGEMYMAEVRRVAHQRAKGLAGQSPILLATLGTQASLVGAAELAWQGLGHR
jgi:hypothetical protein